MLCSHSTLYGISVPSLIYEKSMIGAIFTIAELKLAISCLTGFKNDQIKGEKINSKIKIVPRQNF
jgi:hypothetical protein